MKVFRRRRLILFSGMLLLLAGCGEFNDLVGQSSVTGTVQGQPYALMSGTAEALSGGGYILTLVDDSDYGCSSTPVGGYLTVVIGGVAGEGEFSAVGNVSFNRVEGGTNYTEQATSGSVVIDRVDLTWDEIQGEIDAVGAESRVQGQFSVPICL